jgi:hypothetical protein
MKNWSIILFFLSFCCVTKIHGQSTTISGVVYDISGNRPIEAVIVNSSHSQTMTDSLGRYLITIGLKDSLWFSLLGKQTPKYAIDTITDPNHFNIMIHILDYDLPEVRVRNTYFKYDSIQNRMDYAKYFNYQPPGIKFTTRPTPLSSGGGMSFCIDLDEILNMFRSHRNRNLEFLEKRLVTQEKDRYVNYRFTKRFVQKITHLEGDALQKFMDYCRPSFEVLGLLNDLELGQYIQKKYTHYKRSRLGN